MIYGRAGGQMCTHAFENPPPKQQIVGGVHSETKDVSTKSITQTDNIVFGESVHVQHAL